MSKYDFSNIAALAVTSATLADYTFQLRDGTVLAVVSTAAATDDNVDFLNERVRIAIDAMDKPAKPDTGLPIYTADEVVENRRADCELLAAACVKGWVRAPIDATGKAVPFDPDSVREFLLALPAYLVDPYRSFCKGVFNFAPKPTKPVGAKAVAEMGNASPSGSATS